MGSNQTTTCPITRFWQTCTAAGIHTLSFIAVLCRIESGDSCRKVATSLGIAPSTVWRAVRALDVHELISVEQRPHPGGRGIRLMLCLSDKGRQLLSDLSSILKLTTP